MITRSALAFLAAAAGTMLPAAQPVAEKVEWLRKNSVAVRSIVPGDEDFSDLMPLVKAIGSSRIVALGEATHGDGATFHAKSRLVRFLHQVMDFDVLAWESPPVGCRAMAAALRGTGPVRDAARMGTYGAWSASEQAMPVFEYVRATQKTARPLLTAGFDCRLWGSRQSTKAVADHAIMIFDRMDPALLSAQDRADLEKMTAGLDYSSYFYKPGPRGFNMAVPKRMVAILDENRPEHAAKVGRREAAFTRQLLDNMIKFEGYLETVGVEPRRSAPNRDALMGENLVWLAKVHYPDRKIIVWAHNFHVMAGMYTLKTDEELVRAMSNTNAGPMGMHARRALGNDYYTVGFIGNEGSYGYAVGGEKPEVVPPAPAGTLDALMHQVGRPYLFLDLRSVPEKHWLRTPLSARFYFWKEATTIWPRVYDAVFFTEKLYPSTLAGGGQ